MDLLLIRHAIAAPLDANVKNDAERRLTAEGERRFQQVAQRLVRFAPAPKGILTSPLLRARQTADILAQAWGQGSPTVVPALADGDWGGIRKALAGFADEDTVVLVGHENWISMVTARLLGGKRHQAFDYRKGGVALIRVERGREDRGTLLWLIPPRVLCKL
jgi:phosphohistidine phosphatase